MIGPFQGKHRFLSNFWELKTPVFLAGDAHLYNSVEHAYQAAKQCDDGYRKKISEALTASKAKQLGKQIKGKERPDWQDVKFDIIEDLIRQKFFNNKDLGQLLLDTKDEELVEVNWWGDKVFGQCPVGVGENRLGKILMKIRSELQAKL